MSPEAQLARDAATIILARPAPAGFQVLMVRRHRDSTFMPRVYVYPGGALDPHDCTPEAAERVVDLAPEAARQRLAEPLPGKALGLFLAGVRETFEEAGALLARQRGQTDWIDLTSDEARAARFQEHRIALRAGELSLSELARREDLELAPGQLAYFARWITPYDLEPGRYDARFFIARAPPAPGPAARRRGGHRLGLADPGRGARGLRGRPARAGPAPTLSTLVRLTRFASVDALMDAARACSATHPVARALRGPRRPAHPALARGRGLPPRGPPLRGGHRRRGWTRMVMEEDRWLVVQAMNPTLMPCSWVSDTNNVPPALAMPAFRI